MNTRSERCAAVCLPPSQCWQASSAAGHVLSQALLPPGGAFALYSLLKRAGNFRTFGQAMEADKELSRYSLTKVPHRSSQTQSQLTWQTRMSRSRLYQGVSLE